MSTAIHEISPEEIMAHHDGELTGDRAAEVAVHLQSCSNCSTLAESFDGVSKSTGELDGRRNHSNLATAG